MASRALCHSCYDAASEASADCAWCRAVVAADLSDAASGFFGSLCESSDFWVAAAAV